MFSIKGFVSKCDQIRSFLRIWSHLLKKSLMKSFIFLCSVTHFFCSPKKNTKKSLSDKNCLKPSNTKNCLNTKKKTKVSTITLNITNFTFSQLYPLPCEKRRHKQSQYKQENEQINSQNCVKHFLA